MYAVELVAKRLLESYFSQNYGKRKFKKKYMYVPVRNELRRNTAHAIYYTSIA